MGRLENTIAVVTGASRGAGRGIARALGREGATVWVTGRSTRGADITDDRRETIEETAEEVSAAGGKGIAVRVDHTVDDEVSALIARVEETSGRIDVLVCNAWGGYEDPIQSAWGTKFWRQPLRVWDRMQRAGIRSHLVTARAGAEVMVKQQSGLIILTSVSFPPVGYHGVLSYDVTKRGINRMAFCMAKDLEEFTVTALALAPGWMRTERVLEHYKTTPETWQEVEDLEKTESTDYIGRAVVSLAVDKDVSRFSGQKLEVADLAREYGFKDEDGRQVPPFRELFPEHWD